MTDFRSFLLARLADEAKPTQARRTVVFHSEGHICTTNGPPEHRVEPADDAATDDSWWCDVLRELGTQFRHHPQYLKWWRPFAEWTDADWDEEEGRLNA